MRESAQMATQITSLLVHSQAHHLRELECALRRQSVESRRVASCRVAARLLNSPDPPHLVFVDATLPDGTWRDIVAAAQRAQQAVNVIVVPPQVDMRLYIEALEGGAFDFIAPRSPTPTSPISCTGRPQTYCSGAAAAFRRRHPRSDGSGEG